MASKMDRSVEIKQHPADDYTAQNPAHQEAEHTHENKTAHHDSKTTIDAQIRLTTPSTPKPSPFGTLPAELLGSIMEYLPHQSRAALAMVDRTTVFLGGSYLVSQKPCGEDHLEKNLVHVMQVRDKCSTPKCRRCLALRSITRPCLPRERMDLTSLTGPLPPFWIARKIMRSFRRGADPAPLLARCDISRFTGFHEGETGVKPTSNTAILRVFRGPGKLALKAETALRPHQVRDMVMDQLLPRICAHRSWEDKYPFLRFNKRSFSSSAGCRTVMILHFAFWDWLDGGCVPAHRRPSVFCSENCPHRTKLRCPFSTLLGGIGQCNLCSTEYCLTLAPRPDDPHRRLLVFTVWKALGKCREKDEDGTWNRGLCKCPKGICDCGKQRRPYVSATSTLWELEDSMTAKDGRKMVPWPHYEPQIGAR